MCLAIPGKIVATGAESGTVDFGGVHREISLVFVPEAVTGDWVLVHTGYAMSILSEQEALETISLIEARYGTASLS